MRSLRFFDIFLKKTIKASTSQASWSEERRCRAHVDAIDLRKKER